MTPVKIFQIGSLLKSLLNYRWQPGLVGTEHTPAFQAESVNDFLNPFRIHPDQNGIEEASIEIGPRLDIQSGIDLLNSFKAIPQTVKVVRIELKGAQTAHGAVIQALLAIQKSCKDSGKQINISGFSYELKEFFLMAGLSDLVTESRGSEND